VIRTQQRMNPIRCVEQMLLLCRRTKNLHTVQLMLGHTKLKNTMRYLGLEVDNALDASKRTET